MKSIPNSDKRKSHISDSFSKLAQDTVKSPGKPSLNQVITVNIISDVTRILCIPWYIVTRRALPLSRMPSKSPWSQTSHEKNNTQNQIGKHPT